ncbi:transmembrane protein 14C isoform X2 [Sipha flava]|uniref:Transmembrane protein n=1 Tax=Sipha flava TaxID=143950 RepID=A0A2S2Q5P1_9HEMI|nr:transmembrane protein 14C isoform X2 [Sipha flava]XP_025424838.1 transmembrane protein 14C isoform X2 [Sipha flava]XP_025424839.1 transmembrane protein 14C isoform X2 [Sipha flava]XP_025424841.1 transmembrane protein 14C isoform X2 [Sipha flava]
MTVDYIGFAYAATVAAGGIIGYAKAASIPSLSAGLVFGSLLGYGAYQTTKNPNNLALSLGTSAVLGGIMGIRFINTGKVMPAGILSILSLAMVVRLGARQVIVWTTKNE